MSWKIIIPLGKVLVITLATQGGLFMPWNLMEKLRFYLTCRWKQPIQSTSIATNASGSKWPCPRSRHRSILSITILWSLSTYQSTRDFLLSSVRPQKFSHNGNGAGKLSYWTLSTLNDLVAWWLLNQIRWQAGIKLIVHRQEPGLAKMTVFEP